MLKLLTVEQCAAVTKVYHAKIKTVAAFSLQLVDYLGMLCVRGHWTYLFSRR